jgi:hypothetical protein
VEAVEEPVPVSVGDAGAVVLDHADATTRTGLHR